MFFFLLFIRRQGLTPDQEVVDKHISDLSGKLDVYDKILSKQKYLAGEVRDKFLLLADIAR
jgi:glutathione S-transferase